MMSIFRETFLKENQTNGSEGDSCQQDFDRKRASPTESAVRLDSGSQGTLRSRYFERHRRFRVIGHVRRDIRQAHVTCLKRVEPLSFKGERKSGLNAGGTAEHNKIIVSRPGICNSIPRRDFLCYISEIHQRVFPDSFPKFLPEYRIITFR